MTSNLHVDILCKSLPNYYWVPNFTVQPNLNLDSWSLTAIINYQDYTVRQMHSNQIPAVLAARTTRPINSSSTAQKVHMHKTIALRGWCQ